MGKNKKIAVFLVIIGIVLLVAGGTYTIVTKMNKEKKEISPLDSFHKILLLIYQNH